MTLRKKFIFNCWPFLKMLRGYKSQRLVTHSVHKESLRPSPTISNVQPCNRSVKVRCVAFEKYVLGRNGTVPIFWCWKLMPTRSKFLADLASIQTYSSSLTTDDASSPSMLHSPCDVTRAWLTINQKFGSAVQSLSASNMHTSLIDFFIICSDQALTIQPQLYQQTWIHTL